MQATKTRTRSPGRCADAQRNKLIGELVERAQGCAIDKLKLLCDAATVWPSLTQRECNSVVFVLNRHVTKCSRAPKPPDEPRPVWPSNVYRLSDYAQGNRLALMEGGAS